MGALAPLIKYGYILLFPLAIIEGPVLTLACGFLVTLGVFNPWIIYAIMVVGDGIGDTLPYLFGRTAGPFFFKYIGPYFRITPEKIEKAKIYFHSKRKRAIVFSKMMHGIGFTGLMTAGSLRIPYGKYILVCFITSVIQSAVLLTAGILLGHAYLKLSAYLDYFAAGTLIVGFTVIAFIAFKKFKRNKPTQS